MRQIESRSSARVNLTVAVSMTAESLISAVSVQALQAVKILDHFLHAADYECEAIVIKFVWPVARRVIVRISKRGGVGDHDSRVTLLPE
jgi:hypothetical protein